MSAYFGALLITAAIPVGVIWTSFRQHWRAASALRQQLASCSTSMTIRFTVTNVVVERASAVVHRPVFTPTRSSPHPQPVLRAA